ncbi:unnamed protein product [Trifolium pratense]|uniref:Uncharacterized protein n=1 Tax=Trifolium pratense TaxID=57577 RepID=A0ACB0KXU9_TRIPR|nr:unnamed protein product [Trifolium pratense]
MCLVFQNCEVDVRLPPKNISLLVIFKLIHEIDVQIYNSDHVSSFWTFSFQDLGTKVLNFFSTSIYMQQQQI